MLHGIKTGSTTPAGECLLASSNKDDFELISVVLGAGNTNTRFADSISLFNYGYNNYSMQEVGTQNQTVQTINVKGATKNTEKLDILLQENVYAVVSKYNTSAFLPEIKMNENLKAPISKGDIIGIATYKIDGTTYTCNLIANQDVKSSKMFIIIAGIILVLFVLLLFWKIADMNKRKRKKLYNKIRI